MATVTRYVNTASSGGDGTTNGTSGSTAAYATLSAGLTAEAVDLVAAGDSIVFECDGTVDATRATVSTSWTTGASNTITIRAATSAKHTGQAATGYRLVPTTQSSGDHTLTINVGNVYVDGLEISVKSSTGYGQYGTYAVSVNGDGIYIDNCYIWYGNTSYLTHGIVHKASGSTGTTKVYITNTVVTGFTGEGISNREEGWGTTVEFYCDNCIVDRGGDDSGEGDTGLYYSNGYNTVFQCYNCMGGVLLPAATDNWRVGGGTATFSGDYNWSVDTTGPGASAVDSVTFTTSTGTGTRYIVEDLTSGAEDYMLTDHADNDAIDAGTSVGSSPSDDMLGTTRSSLDIGPFEVAAAASSAVKMLSTLGVG